MKNCLFQTTRSFKLAYYKESFVISDTFKLI